MYLLRNAWLEQINIAIELGHKPSIDLRVHWHNPLLHKCEKRFYPDAWTSSEQRAASKACDQSG
jgi:hypothetical protein